MYYYVIMKIAVTSIAKNEEKFVERWFESALDADQIILVDTGSTDRTKEIFLELKEKYEDRVEAILHEINIMPWRFDNARNCNLALIQPEVDLIIHLDLDEILANNWREPLEQIAIQNPDATRFNYKFVWSWNTDGTPAVQYNSDKIHRNIGYAWKHPAHEILWYPEEVIVFVPDFEIHHFPDNTKPRSQYLSLLQLGVLEKPDDDRIAHYYARELYYYQKYEEAIDEFNRHLELPSSVWKEERAMSYFYMAKCYFMLDKKMEALSSAYKSVSESPHIRESWLCLAETTYFTGLYEDCVFACRKAFSITHNNMLYINDPKAWGPFLYDIGSISAFNLGYYDLALEWIDECVKLTINNDDKQRVINNRKRFKEIIDQKSS